MKHVWQGLAAVLALLLVGSGSRAQAQMPGPYQPPISPYINILRGGASPAINYFNIVQPQLEFNAAIGTLQAQQGALGQAVASQSALGTTTGHPVMFGNYSHYYSMGGRLGLGGSGSLGMAGLGGMGMSGMGMGGMGMGGMGSMGMGGMGMTGMGIGGQGLPGGR